MASKSHTHPGSAGSPAPGDLPIALCRVGVISDTHGLLDPRVAGAFEGVSHIVHAGDIGGAEILEGLGRLAPVTAVRGNTDQGVFGWDLPEQAVLEVCGVRFFVAHDRARLLRSVDVHDLGVEVVVTGHSHAPTVEWSDGLLLLNPGAAGRRRFHLPKAVAVVEIQPAEVGTDRIRPRIVVLEKGSSSR